MAMKQTQTKLFDFSDVGLDFCAGSKTLFPDRFKKMLALGYNEQTVSSVTVAGNQVTFTYGGTHGYVADRVLKVNAPELLSINGGEFVIDNVTANTVTMTIDGAPTSMAGNFTTRVASLGWGLVYENANIHIYKFKALDESDLYLRLCFQDQPTRRNCISPCVGKTADLVAGAITDANALAENRSIMSPADGFKWDFQHTAGTTENNNTYSQGFTRFGGAMVVGSLYHLCVAFNNGSSTNSGQGGGRLSAILPIASNYANLPIMLGEIYAAAGNGNINYLQNAAAYLGNIQVAFDSSSSNSPSTFIHAPQAASSFIEVDEFNATSAQPMMLFERATRQHLGYVAGGCYLAKYAADGAPSVAKADNPRMTMEIDFSNKVVISPVNLSGTTSSSAVYFAMPLEEIKIA
ncbi:hypothetical protein [Acinetobacter sp. YH12106]|uniref:hypothetical protein n=1 Tax=Acinetobacter sp. YH12106 TaxID=2601094 RepID=UPI0015D3C70A|nr:hypothetical protein [Acinetobacter sp. YH12106]